MANKRMINGSIWEDEFFTTLSIFHRLLWVGIITQCADDQGRLRDNIALIRSNVFPLDDISLKDIENGITEFYKAGKIERYKAGNKELIQILNWWKHQSPRWAGASNYPAPDGWVDRERYHGSENKLLTKNWDSKGGYIEGYIVDNTINDIKDDVNDDIKDEDEGKLPKPSTTPYLRIFSQVTGMAGIPGNKPEAFEAIDNLLSVHKTEELTIEYLKPFWNNWNNLKTKNGKPYSKTNLAWLTEYALAGQMPGTSDTSNYSGAKVYE